MRYHGWYKRYYFFENLTGTENDLNHVLSSFVDSEHEIVNFRDSRYIDMPDFKSVFKQSLSNFHILSLNVQSINAKFDNLFPIINNLSASGLYFGAICLQETWLSSNADISMFHIPGYELVHQGFRCTKHGELIVYINEKYSHKLRNLYDKSDVWDCKSITMYRNISRQIENRKSNSTVQKARRKSIWELQTHIFIVFDQLYDYFTTNGLLFNSQYGFRKQAFVT